MATLREQDVEFDVIEYLKTPMSKEDLERVLSLIPNAPAELVRNDKKFKELGLDKADYQDVDSVVALLLEHPALMQRPVAVKGERAMIARPGASVTEMLE